MTAQDSLKPRLLKSSQLGEFTPFNFDGINRSGYEPVGDRVLVGPDSAADMTSGGVHLTPEFSERMTLAAETGVIVACGPDAFLWNSDKTRRLEGPTPKAGDRVYINRYSGQVLLGDDGRVYRLMEYGCIGAVKKTEPAPSSPISFRPGEFKSVYKPEELFEFTAPRATNTGDI
jgi:co-chaperonin GroES (HSP10)